MYHVKPEEPRAQYRSCVFAFDLFRPTGLRSVFQLEAPLLIHGTNLQPADALVQPTAPPLGFLPDKPIAYNITVRNPYTTRTEHRPASWTGGASRIF